MDDDDLSIEDERVSSIPHERWNEELDALLVNPIRKDIGFRNLMLITLAIGFLLYLTR